MYNVTKEVQETIVSSLMKNSYLLSICKNEIHEGYFSDPSCKVIFKSLITYYDRYDSTPGLNELLITIEECYYSQVGVSLPEVKDTCCRLYEYPEPDESFITDKLTDFIRKVRSNRTLRDFVEKVKNNTSLESEDVVGELARSLDIQLSTTKLFIMNNPDQVRSARQNAVGSTDQSRIIKSFIPSLNNCLMFGGWQPGTVNMICSPPGTGKSMYLINEGVSAAKQNFSVLHIFIGDMVEYDGFIRYLSCISGTPQNSLVMMPSDRQNNAVQICNQQYNNIFTRLSVLAYPSLQINVTSLIEDINRIEKQYDQNYDMIIVDYPDNLIQDGRSLYEDGGTLYSSLERMARLTKSVVLVASQPQRCYWNSEIIPLEGAAESSKKQMAVDVMLTMNMASRGANVGSIVLAKARKGEVGRIFRVKTNFECCRMEEIDEATYNAIKSSIGIK